ncbi:MAG: hypothetical protein ACD_79C00972G0003 [uncultured bacterium]|nr:MAG: hypothetical protein ACD_79C00972G0003 [uncultured bacterium]
MNKMIYFKSDLWTIRFTTIFIVGIIIFLFTSLDAKIDCDKIYSFIYYLESSDKIPQSIKKILKCNKTYDASLADSLKIDNFEKPLFFPGKSEGILHNQGKIAKDDSFDSEANAIENNLNEMSGVLDSILKEE